ncbi:MAG TPA: M13 family metallopeptidase [Pyrinomonadaceae bacterium]|jgi:putative endopeptidase
MRSLNLRLVASVLTTLVVAFAALAQSGGHSGFDPARMDTTCQPCEDFYKYANGNWAKSNPIPPAYSSWGSFQILADKNRNALQLILEEAAKNTNARRGTNEQKIGAFYASCMDEAKIDAAGIKPLTQDLARIEKIRDVRGLQAEIAHMHRQSISVLFNFGSVPDFKNSTMVIANVSQGGLSLPNRDYYTKDDEKSRKTREEFVAYVTRMFQLLGDDAAKAAANAKTVMAFQTRLAEASLSPVQLRDPVARYNKMEVSKLNELAPDFGWSGYFAARGVGKLSEINVSQPTYFKTVNSMFASVPLADWKTYLRWQLINAAAPLLSSKFENEAFNFYGRTLTGAKEMQPRWKRCVNAVDNSLGEALGQVYVEKSFSADSKARMQEMVRNLITAFRSRLMKLEWMSDETRQQALAKLDAFKQKIGYPDKWRDYGTLDIERASYVENSRRAAMFEVSRNLNKIGKPVDRTEWGMTPPTVNAYYSSLFNEIAFPAGILQHPFFDPNADDAINYGAIGGVIGHEITHGFDDSGSQFDAAGNLRMWWTPDDRKKFDERAGCIVNQFSGYKVEEGLFMQGKLVQGESIADLGGLTVAYDAYQKSLEGKPRPANIDGFTPEQRFFLGWAQVWASNDRPEAERLRANTGPHPLPRFRVNGPLSNLPQFAAAFNCKQGDPMVRPANDRCQIW